jgi:formiminotetrahydrofolate cyclodeaminase
MSEQLLDQTMHQFLGELASAAPAPGGGSVAALTGAMAAGLLTMVCDLTIGKQAYAAFEDEARTIRARAERLRIELQLLLQADVEVFTRLMAAYKLPRATDADAANRKAAIQQATRAATEVPLHTAQATAALLPLCLPLARQGSRNAVSDVGVAAQLIRAAVPSALLNVDINLPALEDVRFVSETRDRVAEITGGLEQQVDRVLVAVQERIAS